MYDYAAALDAAYKEYSKKVFVLACRARTEIEEITLSHRLGLACGMGTWVMFSTDPRAKPDQHGSMNIYVEDMENPPKDLLNVVAVLDINIEGMRDNAFGSIM